MRRLFFLLLVLTEFSLSASTAIGESLDTELFQEESSELDADTALIDYGLDLLGGDDNESKSGPGFRKFRRAMLGGYLANDRNNFEAGFEEQTRALASISIQRQQLWGGDTGKSLLSGWRGQFDLAGLFVDLGRLPVSDQAHGIKASRATGAAQVRNPSSPAYYYGYGLQFVEVPSAYEFEQDFALLGPVSTDTEVFNWMIGPQFTLGRVAIRRRWMFDIIASLTLGYGRSDFELTGQVGSETLFGGLNPSIVLASTVNKVSMREEHFGQHAELRFIASRLVKRNWSFDLGARLFVNGPFYDAVEHVEFTVPAFGLSEGKPQYLLGGNLFAGLTYLH